MAAKHSLFRMGLSWMSTASLLLEKIRQKSPMQQQKLHRQHVLVCVKT